MESEKMCLQERLALLRMTGMPVSAVDETRVRDSITAALESLDKAVQGSLFDTEPQTFDVVLRRLADGGKR